MEIPDKYKYLILVVILMAAVTIAVIRTHNENVELSTSSSMVVAKIIKIEGARGLNIIYIHYLFHGKSINTEFSKSNIDSIRPGSRIRILVKDSIPEHMRYIGLEKF